MRYIEKSKLRFPIRKDIIAWLTKSRNFAEVPVAKGAGVHHPASFIEEPEDGSIVLYGPSPTGITKYGRTKYDREEYRSWCLDDVQINAYQRISRFGD